MDFQRYRSQMSIALNRPKTLRRIKDQHWAACIMGHGNPYLGSLSPRGRYAIRVCIAKMVQGRNKPGRMHCVFAQKRRANVVHYHLLNIPLPVLLAQQILTQYRGGNFRDMFMLRDSRDFILGKATQCNTIFKRDHPDMLMHPRGR